MLALDPSAGFVRARPGMVTNSGRNNIESPGLNNLDLQITKNTYITETMYVQFRAELFNALNHRQFSFANSSIFSATSQAQFVTSPVNPGLAGGGGFRDFTVLNGGNRTIQLGLKFFF